MHFITMIDLANLAVAQPHLVQEISVCHSQSIDLTVEGTFDHLTHAYRRLRQVFGPAILAQFDAITISFLGNRFQIGNARHQRALIRSFVERLPNLRRLQMQIHFSWHPIGPGVQVAPPPHDVLFPAALGQARRHMERLDLDGTILREGIVLNAQLFFAIPGGGAIRVSNTHVVRRPTDRL